MNAADHLAEAERLLTTAGTGAPAYILGDTEPVLLAALTHAVIAVADVLGVAPHTTGGGESGATA